MANIKWGLDMTPAAQSNACRRVSALTAMVIVADHGVDSWSMHAIEAGRTELWHAGEDASERRRRGKATLFAI